MTTARVVAALTSWIVFGAVSLRCFALGATGLGLCAAGMVVAHALAEIADFERRDRRRARAAYLAQQRAGAHLVSYLPHRDDRLWTDLERRRAG